MKVKNESEFFYFLLRFNLRESVFLFFSPVVDTLISVSHYKMQNLRLYISSLMSLTTKLK